MIDARLAGAGIIESGSLNFRGEGLGVRGKGSETSAERSGSGLGTPCE